MVGKKGVREAGEDVVVLDDRLIAAQPGSDVIRL